MRQTTIMVGVLAFLFGIMGALIAHEISVWSECLSSHSYLYCSRVLGR